MEAKTKIIFRVWKKEGGEVIALFPEEQYDLQGLYCESYMHAGQHGAADYYGLLKVTRPATKEESKELRDELEGFGHILDEKKRYVRK